MKEKLWKTNSLEWKKKIIVKINVWGYKKGERKKEEKEENEQN